MTDCSQLPTELADAEQQRDGLPQNPIQYCLENSDNLQEYKACLRDIRQQALALDAQISALSNNIEICDALIGTWIINSTNTRANGQQFTITTWDTQGPLRATFTFNDGISGQVVESDYAAVFTPFPELLLTINGEPGFPGDPPQFGYTANLDRSTPSPQLNNGYIGGLPDPNTSSGIAEWTATKS
jgi:hypothetical protein